MDPRLHFGLGANVTVDTLEVRWQSGVVQTFENLPVNREHIISEFSDTQEGVFFKAVWTNGHCKRFVARIQTRI